MQKKYDVVAVGNALVDVLAEVEDITLQKLNLVKGSMQLCDGKQAAEILSSLPKTEKQAGGSAANSLSGLAALGTRTAFMGMIGKDDLGDAFTKSMSGQGIDFFASNAVSDTGHCLVLISPDAQRTMATHLGAAAEFDETGINEDCIKAAKILYLEGYLFDSEKNKSAFHHAAKIAKENDVKVALTLSDSFCVDRHRADFLQFIKTSVDILFANEDEILGLAELSDKFDALKKISSLAPIIFMTCGADGAIISDHGEILQIPAVPCDKLTDTTGAGDAFAAGALHGIGCGADLQKSAQLGVHLATQIISIYGGRLHNHDNLFPSGW